MAYRLSVQMRESDLSGRSRSVLQRLSYNTHELVFP
jgi:hypothetical protein